MSQIQQQMVITIFFFSLNLLATTTNQRLELLIGSTKIKSLVHLCNKKKNNRNKLK